nr:GAF domain-containing sensor histidine kinase [Nitrospirota bacterium]
MLTIQTPTRSVSPLPNRRLQWRRHEDLKLLQRERELEAARRICQALFQHINVDTLVERALRTALEVVGAEAGSVLLAEPETKQLVFRYIVGVGAELLYGTRMPWEKGIAGAVFHSGESAVIGDVASDDRHFSAIDAHTGYTTRDMIVLPLRRWGGESIGVLEILNKREGRLNHDDLGILTIISALSAEAIEQARLFEEAKLAEVVRLLGDIAHDVKNLLQPMVSASGLLQAELEEFYGGLPPAEQAKVKASREFCMELIAMLRGSGRRIQERTKEIADCVKGLSVPPLFASCRVADVVGHVVRTLGKYAEEKGLVLRAEGLDDLPVILADENRLFNAFYNLVNNAIPEVPAGGSITVRGRAKPDAGVVLLEVADTGRGMSAEVRACLFTARAVSRKAGGTGLGTKIVKDVVDAHGGEISVDSEEGKGTIFHLLLPIRPPGCSPH